MVGMIAAGRAPGTDKSRSLSAYDYAVTLVSTNGIKKAELDELRAADVHNAGIYKEATEALNELSVRSSALAELEGKVADARADLATSRRTFENGWGVRTARMDGEQRKLAEDRADFDANKTRRTKELDDRSDTLQARESVADNVQADQDEQASKLKALATKLREAAKRINDRQDQLQSIVGDRIEI